MRHIIFDTETTGLSFQKGDRLVEIAAIELVDWRETGEQFHTFINPERDMPEEAQRVHGLTSEFLSDKPKFVEIHEKFLEFIQDSTLVAHNISFDRGFLNGEFGVVGLPPLSNPIIDTLMLARKKFPGRPASLDKVCSYLGISTAERVKHGAMIDTKLLAKVFVELSGRNQLNLGSDDATNARTSPAGHSGETRIARAIPPVLPARRMGAPSPEEDAIRANIFGGGPGFR